MQASSLLYGRRQWRSPGPRRWWPSYSQVLSDIETRLRHDWGGRITSTTIDIGQGSEQLFVLTPNGGGNTISLRLSSFSKERVLAINCPQHNRDAAAGTANRIRKSLEGHFQDWGIDRLRVIISGRELLSQPNKIEFDDIKGSNPYSARKQMTLLIDQAKQRHLINKNQLTYLLQEGLFRDNQLDWLRSTAIGCTVIEDQLLAVNYRIGRATYN